MREMDGAESETDSGGDRDKCRERLRHTDTEKGTDSGERHRCRERNIARERQRWRKRETDSQWRERQGC